MLMSTVVLIGFAALVGYVSAEEVASIPQRDCVAFPDVGAYQVLRGDFHMHTIHSDGKLTPAERVKESYELGYDVIAITDHGNFKAYEEAEPLANSFGLILIRGLETGLADSGKNKEHLVALGFSDKYEPRQPHKWETNRDSDKIFYQEEMKRLARDGGFLILAHPNYAFREPITWGIRKGYIQGMETRRAILSEDVEESANQAACYQPEPMRIAGMNRQAFFGNTDAHKGRGEAYAVTLVFARERTVKGVMGAIRDARTIAWHKGRLWGHEDLLSDFVRESVDIRMTTDDKGECWLHFKNKTPVSLKAQIIGEECEAFDIPGNTEVSIPHDSRCPRIQIEWENLWISSQENLETTRKLKASLWDNIVRCVSR